MRAPPSSLRGWIVDHELPAFFIGAYLISWTLWAPAALFGLTEGPAVAILFLGVFGPASSAAIITKTSGRSVRAWLRSIFKRRAGLRWYALALGFPVLLIAVAQIGVSLAGEGLDTGLFAERLITFAPVLLFCLLLNGGPEEPGWRGFALPRLQERMAPVGATATLGVIWGLWHVPLLLATSGASHGLEGWALVAILAWTLLGIVAYAFSYTYVWNKTRSIVVCMLLHAAYNTANVVLLLMPESRQEGSAYVTISVCLTGTLLISMLLLIVATKGRLGLPRTEAERPHRQAAPVDARAIGATPSHGFGSA